MGMGNAAAAGLLALIAGAAVCGYGAESSGRREENALRAGEQAPPLTLQRLFQAPEGTVASWDALKGKTTIIEFWSIGCGPCLQSIPHMNELAEAMKDKPVQFIAVTRDDQKRVEHFIAKRRMAAWVGIDGDKATFNAYGVRAVPRTVLVDAQGRIAAVTRPSRLSAENILNIIAGKDPGIEPRGGGMCDVRKGACGEKGGDEAVSITLRKSEDGSKRGGCMSGPGSIEVSNMPAEWFLPHVYGIVYDIPRERIEIKAKLPEGVRYYLKAKARSGENSALREPLRGAIEKEFGLRSRLETEETDVYVVSVDPEKRALITAAEESDDRGVAHVDKRQIIVLNRPIEDLARRLEKTLSRPVVDETGLDGEFDLVAEWAGEGVEPMTKAMRDSLGLVVTPARRPLEILTVTNADAR